MTVSGLPLDLQPLAVDIHRDNIAAGWWKQDEVTGRTLHRNIGELLALVHSEISEADEGYRLNLLDDKLPHRRMPEVELADVAIRVLDMLGFYEHDCRAGSAALPLPMGPYWEQWCLKMHRETTRALEGFRKGDVAKGCHHLVDLLGVVHFAARMFGYDLTSAIAEKRAFNAERSDHKLENRAKSDGKQF